MALDSLESWPVNLAGRVGVSPGSFVQKSGAMPCHLGGSQRNPGKEAQGQLHPARDRPGRVWLWLPIGGSESSHASAVVVEQGSDNHHALTGAGVLTALGVGALVGTGVFLA